MGSNADPLSRGFYTRAAILKVEKALGTSLLKHYCTICLYY